MNKMKKLVSLLLVALVLCSVAVMSVTVSAAETDVAESEASGITVHYYTESGKTPTVYYWNSLPTNISTTYPGKAMTKDATANWYSYTFSNVTKINMLFIDNGVQSKELTRSVTGTTNEWWYKNNRWYDKDPGQIDPTYRTDLREESIYFVITTRFYDGETGNNVHCWDDGKAGNPDSDPAWRGDFQGLIDKLDYIKALGFSAIWITPVVENASGYDYHGYHSFDITKVDPRYESEGATYADLIQAAHEKDIRIVQDVVWNHTGNFGDPFLAPMFTKEYDTLQDLGDPDCMKMLPDSDLARVYPSYETMQPDPQFQARLDVMKDLQNNNMNTNEHYHRERGMGYESSIEQQGSMAGDCVDINTENPVVAKYITDTYLEYANMGVDAFRLDTEKHINRWTLNNAYFPAFDELEKENFHIFGEVCSRVRETWNHNIPSSSPAFFSWKETESAWIGNWNSTDKTANIATSIAHYDAHRDPSGLPTSQNAFLNGINYRTPDYSKANGTSVIDFTMHWNFENAGNAYRAGLAEDQYMNDSTYNVMYVDSHDYGPDGMEKTRYSLGTQAWAENLNLIFSFRGIPCLYYGSEIEFAKGVPIDVGPGQPLATTGRAYFGDHIEGTVTATNFGEYTASGAVNETLNYPLAVHIRKLNMMRRAIPALQKGQYTNDGTYVSGNMAYVRRYTNASEGVDSLALVTISGGATFKNIPNGTYIDAVTGKSVNVTNGTLTTDSIGTANMRIYVCCASGFTGINGKIGPTGTYLK